MKQWKSKKKFAKVQPKDGDVVLYCVHLKEAGLRGHTHFYGQPDASFPFRRPDGTIGQAQFCVVCPKCHGSKNPIGQIGGDGIWSGDDPIVTVDPKADPERN